MRKLLCLMLAVIMVVSVAVVAVNAAQTAPTGAGTATVTIQSVKGDTVTKTYAVGETFTTYTYLNASQINDGKIGSLNCSQFYTNSVLELAEDYDPEWGDIFDVDTIFPVTKQATVASGHWTESEEYAGMGAVYYNATIASYNGFKFDADDKALIICRYTVKAAGEATILNEITTLAQSDYELTRIVNRGKIVNDNFTSPVALSEPAAPSGFTLSGTATSYKTNDGVDDVTLTLTGSDNNYTDTATVTAAYKGVKADTAYSFANVPAGNYVLSVAKGNHVTREYTVEVSADTTQDVKICPIGDADGNGRVNAADSKAVFKHANEEATIDDEYMLKCSDVSKPLNRVNSVDSKAIFQHANEVVSLWTVTAE
ncbi:MAG: carboxypeptidase regulatory-like domain-containing protein [Ruminococcus sp.]|nr:carboxypeptidase regulatory-like domain-containing protein [Ruminococcus sp.]